MSDYKTFTFASALLASVAVSTTCLARADSQQWPAEDEILFTHSEQGHLQRDVINRSELQKSYPNAINIDGIHYYDKLRTASSFYATECTSHARMDQQFDVSFTAHSLCKKKPWPQSDSYQEWPVRYRVVRHLDGAHIAIKVRYDLSASDNSPAWLQRIDRDVRACVPFIQDFWARYGVRFDLTVDTNAFPGAGSPDEHSEVLNALCRSYTNRLCYQGLPELSQEFQATYNKLKAIDYPKLAPSFTEYYEPIRQDGLCRTMTHEIGHYLGLTDHYADKSCPDREYIQNASANSKAGVTDLMDDEWGGWDTIDIMPNDIERILAPLCTE